MAYGLNDLILQVIAYAIIIFGILFLLNFLTKGFILKYIRVKASRGAKQLVRVHGITGVKYRIGKTDGGVLVYKENGKLKRHHKANRYNVMRELGIDVFEVDEPTGNVRTVDWRSTPGHNVDHFDNILVRALERPNLADKTKETLMFIMAIATVLMLGFALFLLYNINQKLGAAPAGGGVI